MRYILFIIIISAVFLFVAAIIYYGGTGFSDSSEILFKKDSENTDKESAQPVLTAEARTTKKSQSQWVRLNQEIRSEIKDCLSFSIEGFEKGNDPVLDLFTALESRLGPMQGEEEFLSERILIQDQMQNQFELRILAEKAELGTHRRLHYFQKTSAGELAPLPVPESEQKNPSDEVIAKYVRQGDIERSELTFARHYTAGYSAELLKIDELFQNVSIQSPKGLLRCGMTQAKPQRIQCQCL